MRRKICIGLGAFAGAMCLTSGAVAGIGDFPPLLAQDDAAGAIIGLLCQLVLMAVFLGIAIYVLLLLKGCLEQIPPQYRAVEPNMVWLLLIPCVNIIANFLVFPKIGKSFANYFHAHGRTDVEDAGEQMGLFYAIAAIICGPVALVLLIMLLVKWLAYKKEIPDGAT